MVKALLGVLLLLPAATGEETFTVAGTVRLPGPVPATRPNKKLEGDLPCCALHKETPPLDNLVVDPEGGVRWSFVYVKKGLGAKTFEPPKEAVTIDQTGCRYAPHLVGVQVGQLVNFRNTDPLLHNVHGLPSGGNKEFNFGQTQGSISGVKFPFPEVPIKVICNVHPWMASFVCVVEHPFYAVTDGAGKFEIRNLPPGTYTLGIWHEGVEADDQVITLNANQIVNFATQKKQP